MESQYKYQMKTHFKQRVQTLLPEKRDFEEFVKTIHTEPKNYVRCNTLKISTQELFARLQKKWPNTKQPFERYPEIFLIDQNLFPGELGNALEHVLGYYYIQEVSSMLSIIALDPKPGELILDLFASPGSKTTQLAAKMENRGTIIANDLKIDRIRVLVSNLERCGVANTITTRKDAIAFCANLSKSKFPKFDRVLIDVPCSGEGTLRSNPKIFLQWNQKVISKFSRQQKRFLAFALKLLKKGGTLVYSTCTHSPEENEEVISFALGNFPIKAEILALPLKCRPGIKGWKNQRFHRDIVKSCRIYPHDNDSEGFFVSKFTLQEEIK